MVRDDTPPEDTVLLVRAATADTTRNLRNVVSDATESGRTYVIDRVDGRREILYGVSVYAQPRRPGRGGGVAPLLPRPAMWSSPSPTSVRPGSR